VGCGIAYNFYFKFSPLSPLPYAIACAALPASVYYSVDRTPPLWVIAGGSLLGVGFHFLNVLKDIEKDQMSSIKGLPQIVGKRASAAIALVLIGLAVLVVLNR
jgi:4-hydroxybenzoate polyprenyltransferase